VTERLSLNIAELAYNKKTAILYDKLKAGYVFGLLETKRILDAERSLIGDDLHAQVISFESYFISPTKEAKEFVSEELKKMNRVSIAFVVESLSIRMLLNSFIQLYRPEFPTRIFKTMEEAENWSGLNLTNVPVI
jgi:hypothetical protein